MVVAVPARPRRGDLPLRVRPPPGAQVAQADPRGPGRHPERRARRSSPSSSSRRRSCSGFTDAGALQPDVGRASASGILSIPLVASVSEDALRSRARRAARGELRPGRPQDHHRRPGSCSRPRCRAWSPRSSSPSPGPSARRWSCSSPAARPANQRVRAEPARAGPHDDRGHGLAGRRAPTRSVGEALDVPEPLLRRVPSCSSSRSCSTSSPTASCAGSGRPTDGARSTHRRRRRRRRRGPSSSSSPAGGADVGRRGSSRPAPARLARRLARSCSSSLLVRRGHDRRRSCSPTGAETSSSRRPPHRPPAPASSRRIRGHVLDRRLRRRARVPDRRRPRRSTSRSTPPRAGSPVHRREHPQPGRRAVGRLRDPRALDLRPAASKGVTGGAHADRGRHHPRHPRAPDRDHHLGRGDPGRARAASARPASASGATRWEVIRTHVLPYAAARDPHRHRPGPRPGPRRGRPAAPVRRGHRPARRATTGCFDPSQLQERFTALPIVIADWARTPARRVRRDRRRRHHRDAGHRPGHQLRRHPAPQPLREEEGRERRWSRRHRPSTERPSTWTDRRRRRRRSSTPRRRRRPRGRVRRRRPQRLLRRLPGRARRRPRRSTSTRSPPSSARRAAARPPCCAASTA